MGIIKFLIKVSSILVFAFAICLPFLLEYLTFVKDQKRKISYKRFRMVAFAFAYCFALTIIICVFSQILQFVSTLPIVSWIVGKLSANGRFAYSTTLIAMMVLNFAIGFVFWLLSKFVRIGTKKKNLTTPKTPKGFNCRQKAERAIIKFFYNETWFFIKRILLYVNLILSALYITLFVFYQIPMVFAADWIPYKFISSLFKAGYTLPVLSLISMWELYFFISGIERLDEECPEFIEPKEEVIEDPTDIDMIDAELKRQFKDFYACDLCVLDKPQEEVCDVNHHEITRFIGFAVENDKRNPLVQKEVYLRCIDELLSTDDNILVNGCFFSEFSLYFLRYLSAIIARGDNVIFVCNSDSQIDAVYEYLDTAFKEQSSIYCPGYQTYSIDFDNPIWRIVKVSGDKVGIQRTMIDDNSVLITTMNYLCSADFEKEHSKFIQLVDTIVFVDTLQTVNDYSSLMAMLNVRLGHITKSNALLAMNGGRNGDYHVRYLSKPIRYVCFDDTRTPGLDRVLGNLMSKMFTTVDSMRYAAGTKVRCYNYEGRPDKTGKINYPQLFPTKENVGPVLNMAMLCLIKGAKSVSVFADDILPYRNMAESMFANMGQMVIKVDQNAIRINRYEYNPEDYSVIIAIDDSDDLPATVRKYVSITSDKPSLVIVFSRPYMMRDYFVENLSNLWISNHLKRIPVETESNNEVAQKVLLKANAGGITEKELVSLVSNDPAYSDLVEENDINGILRKVLESFGDLQNTRIDVFKTFEYSSNVGFDEIGVFAAEDKIHLRQQGMIYDIISGRNKIIMNTGDNEIILPLSKSRMTQNYIVGQNLLYNGLVYKINCIDTTVGKMYVKLAVGGINDEKFQYIQDREYRLDFSSEEYAIVSPTKNVVVKLSEDDVRVDNVFVSVFRVPAEVITKGYYCVDPYSLAKNVADSSYYNLDTPENERVMKQTYRRYGEVTDPYYSSENILSKANLVAYSNGMLALSVRLTGVFGADVNKTMAIAAAMLNEILHSMFPSVADSIVVCPVYKGDFKEESEEFGRSRTNLSVIGDRQDSSKGDFELLVIEDCVEDLGVVSVLSSAGDDLLHTLFSPIYDYLDWYVNSKTKSEYLYYGLDHEPKCYDFTSLYKLSKALGDNKHSLRFVEIDDVVEFDVCDFCGKRFSKADNIIHLEDGRRMCKNCAENLVGNNKKVLKDCLERAKRYLESTYGISLDDDYEFCLESTVKITNMLKRNKIVSNKGSNSPIKTLLDDKKRVYVEDSIPMVNLMEMLVRELTHVWQLKHIPNVTEDLAEGHIALVGIQYLRFLNETILVSSRVSLYETSKNISGEGYRKLVSALLENPQYNNNPFKYLLEHSGVVIDDEIITPVSKIFEMGDFGLPYTPETFDRALDGNIEYFYYSRITPSMQKVYDSLLTAIKNFEPSVEVGDYTMDEVYKVSRMILYDHPEVFWYRTFTKAGSTVNPVYGTTKEDAVALQKRIDEVVPKYLEGIDDSMSAYDVALRIHVKMISSVDYDSIALDEQKQKGGPLKDEIDYLRSICGVFIRGTAVCEGYARAMQYLLQKCGIECAEVVGDIVKPGQQEGGGHAWNILKVDGDYYYLDTTWDDRSNTIQTVKKDDIGFDYFCITTEELTRTRNFNDTPSDVPSCTATRANYYYHNNLVLDSYDLKKIKEIAQTAAKNNHKLFTFKCKKNAVYEQALDQLCAKGQDCYDVLKVAAKVNKKIRSNGFSYTYDKNIWTITIKFKYKE